jgi:hypothetical protein
MTTHSKSGMLGITAALVAGLALALAAGCGKDKGGSDGGNLSPEAQKDLELGRKLAPFIAMCNRFADRVYDSHRRYTSWQKDPAQPPTCKERYISHGLYSIYAVKDHATKVQEATEAKPRIKDVEAAGQRMLLALDKLEPLLKKASKYYDSKDYKDDGCKGAQSMHPQLMSLFKDFIAADQALTAAIRKVSLPLRQRLAARSEKNSPRYYHHTVALAARQLLHQMRNRGEELPDVLAVEKTMKKFSALVAEMDRKASNQKEPSGYKRFRGEVGDFLKACKERFRRLKKGKKMSGRELASIKSGSGWMVNGSFAKVLRTFNELVDASNSVERG